jgi:hypothetical protein
MQVFEGKLQRSHAKYMFVGLVLLVFIGACAPSTSVPQTTSVPPDKSVLNPTQTKKSTLVATLDLEQEATSITEPIIANVLNVEVTGQPNAYRFNVQVASPDTGCDQYADWWEVLSEDGQLLYRRVLLHSHVSEQPFTRSGGPVAIDGDTVVIVRAHMNVGGYGGAALRGSASGGFESVQLGSGFAAEVEALALLPEGCAF